MSETNVPDPWANKPEINIDDGSSFAAGYDANTFTITNPGFLYEPPKYAGYWDVYPPDDFHHFRIFLVKRPNFFHRLMNKLLIGWVWNDT